MIRTIEPHRNVTRPGPRHHWYEPQHPNTTLSSKALCIRFLLIILFAVLLFVLGHAMVVHHFFAGGALNNHQGRSVGP